AARELDRAWLVSPYDRERLADVYHAALSETSDESCARMRDLRSAIHRRTVFDWARKFIEFAIHAAPARSPGRVVRRAEPSDTRRPQPNGGDT
ncbi:MAG: hypothetical protein ABIS67_00155, partial [Candidatus Eisenbacteria bacterium]